MKFPLGVSGRRRLIASAGAGALVAAGLIAVSASPAQAQIACRVDYVKAWEGGNGFGANVTINNLGAAINGWELEFNFPGNQQISNGWIARWSQSGQAVSAVNESWSALIPAGGSLTLGFNATFSGSNQNPTTFFLNGVQCTGQPGPGPTGSPTPSPTSSPDPGPGPGQRVPNPYANADVYVNPDWSQAAEDGGAPSSIYNQPTGVWMDTRAAITGGTTGENMSMADHLDEAVAQDAANGSTPLVIQFVIYNLPGRDCAALASNGELGPNDLPIYKSQYIDVITGIMDDPQYASLRIVNIIEIDSLPNLVTNVSPRETGTSLCDQMLQNQAYQNGVAYAVSELGDLPNTYNYIDAAHHGWIGWEDPNPQFDNFNATAIMMASILGREGATAADVHGFITNTANYSALDEPFFNITDVVGGRPIREVPGTEGGWIDWNDHIDETTFAVAFRNRLVTAGFNSGIGMLIDTSRNGWGGPDRPTGTSTSTNPVTYMNESRIDRRIQLGNWCNQSGAGLGERPQASPQANIDAYVWIKPPGESDGSSQLVPVGPENPDGKGFDRMCDPTFTEGTPRNGNNPSGALPGAPVSGRWFQAQFDQLLDNAFPPV
jgi:cellulose 1,4-beta-cellobiosidase